VSSSEFGDDGDGPNLKLESLMSDARASDCCCGASALSAQSHDALLLRGSIGPGPDPSNAVAGVCVSAAGSCRCLSSRRVATSRGVDKDQLENKRTHTRLPSRINLTSPEPRHPILYSSHLVSCYLFRHLSVHPRRSATMSGKFAPKEPVVLNPPKDDPISPEELAAANGEILMLKTW
jgi:hypothetical protein